MKYGAAYTFPYLWPGLLLPVKGACVATRAGLCATEICESRGLSTTTAAAYIHLEAFATDNQSVSSIKLVLFCFSHPKGSNALTKTQVGGG